MHVPFQYRSIVHYIISPINVAIFLTGCLVLAWFAKSTVQWQTSKHQYSSSPLQNGQRMPKDQHWAKNCEELACRRNNAASQWAKICHRQENKILQINTSKNTQQLFLQFTWKRHISSGILLHISVTSIVFFYHMLAAYKAITTGTLTKSYF